MRFYVEVRETLVKRVGVEASSSQVHNILSQLKQFRLVEKKLLENGKRQNVYMPAITETDFMSQIVNSILALML